MGLFSSKKEEKTLCGNLHAFNGEERKLFMHYWSSGKITFNVGVTAKNPDDFCRGSIYFTDIVSAKQVGEPILGEYRYILKTKNMNIK